ncbi:hypothetical protein CAEBREN_07986 [Caenorhabditis brenneri]|uniref:F-box domain-containing protein n=1 Tax=Caenorhabditis brenneri TaxID=135651 RepID=G0N3Y3_CAEBE|nr:hypothetical protein CAEBREN_07986 [Caenorhabditis brenneri]
MSSDETEKTPAELLSLPNEVLCYLFTFIPPHDAITKIPLVCKRFSLIIKDAKFWSTRIRNEQSVRMPQCELRHPDYSPQKSFYMIHQQNQRWKDWESQRIITAPGHMATVDSVMLFSKNEKLFCLSGSRDRSIRLWDIQNVGSGENSEENKWTVAQNDTAHSGWIWNVSRNEDSEKFYTTSWDSTVKEWSIPDGGALQELNSVNLGSAVQCVSTSGSSNEVVCTTFARRTAVIDTRSFKIVADHQLHKKAVIGLAVQGDKIFTSSEDRMMMMVDRRMMSKAVLFEYCPKSYKTSLSLQRHQLLTSTSDGKVKLYDANNFNVVQSYTVTGILGY